MLFIKKNKNQISMYASTKVAQQPKQLQHIQASQLQTSEQGISQQPSQDIIEQGSPRDEQSVPDLSQPISQKTRRARKQLTATGEISKPSTLRELSKESDYQPANVTHPD